MFYVYIHRRNTDGSIFYVGKGSKNRAYNKISRNRHWHNTVNKYGYTVEIIQNHISEWMALELEKYLISEYRNLGYTLCNLTDGGEGSSGYTHTEEAKKKMSVARKGRTYSDAYKKAMSDTLKGRKFTQEHKDKIGASRKGDKHPLAIKANIYTKEGKLIAESVILREWCVHHPGYTRTALVRTAHANRDLPSSRTNLHFHKGLYAVYI